eukprot:19294-Heterococcus_DN1.PRE.7
MLMLLYVHQQLLSRSSEQRDGVSPFDRWCPLQPTLPQACSMSASSWIPIFQRAARHAASATREAARSDQGQYLGAIVRFGCVLHCIHECAVVSNCSQQVVSVAIGAAVTDA